MIIGNGQVATIFKNDLEQEKYKDVCIFASGVSNSNCQDSREFKREENLLLENIAEYKNRRFVYFSSCAVSSPDYPRNDYYNHKLKMEKFIRSKTKNYLICRVPQLFGDICEHNTLINFLFAKIISGESFTLYSHAYRYVLDIDDLKKLVDALIVSNQKDISIDIGNYTRYEVKDLLFAMEKICGTKAHPKIVERHDGYVLNFDVLKKFISDENLDIGFGADYFPKRIDRRISRFLTKD